MKDVFTDLEAAKCPFCDVNVKRGLKFMLDHWVEFHDGKEKVEELIKLRIELGREITLKDYETNSKYS